MLFILWRPRPLSMMSLWHHGSRCLTLIYGVILTPYDTIIVIHLIGQWHLSLLSIIRAVYLFISYCTYMYKQYWALYKTGLTASLNNKLSCSCSLIITALRLLPLYLTATLCHNQDYQLSSKSPLGSYSLPVPAQTRPLQSHYISISILSLRFVVEDET